MVLGADAAALGGPVANSGGWLRASDETHCGKMAALQVCARSLYSITPRTVWLMTNLALCDRNFLSIFAQGVRFCSLGAALLGGPVSNSGGWLRASDETHRGQMVALHVWLGLQIWVLVFGAAVCE
jgi:hypothetical protein